MPTFYLTVRLMVAGSSKRPADVSRFPNISFGSPFYMPCRPYLPSGMPGRDDTKQLDALYDLLVRYGLIATDDVVEYANEIRQLPRRKLPRVDLKGPSI